MLLSGQELDKKTQHVFVKVLTHHMLKGDSVSTSDLNFHNHNRDIRGPSNTFMGGSISGTQEPAILYPSGFEPRSDSVLCKIVSSAWTCCALLGEMAQNGGPASCHLLGPTQ